MLRARNGVCRDVSVQLSVCVVAVASVCFQSLEVWLCYGPSSVAVCDHGRVASWVSKDVGLLEGCGSQMDTASSTREYLVPPSPSMNQSSQTRSLPSRLNVPSVRLVQHWR